MHLKSLTLNGYKTFATKTRFEFSKGITCIIGPNGSGKSNIADGIRWALGEQQFSLLRGKKTEDMIFSGSPRRPRASMAEVILTFDNSNGFFPIAFSEIEIGRRAYRDGSNEYLLNGNRVRLRDITDLLGHSGLAERTYTVIGQGLVDSALAQKPEERRALFEEAAGIIAYRERREEALRKLEETRQNLARVRDIISEIEPRLRQLERQAERARQHRALSAALHELTRQWLGHRYHALRRALHEAEAMRVQARLALQAAQLSLSNNHARMEVMRQRRARLQRELEAAQAAHGQAQRLLNAAQQELAIVRERLSALVHQERLAERELAEAEQARAQAEAHLERTAQALAEAEAWHAQQQHALQAAQAEAATSQAHHRALEHQRAQAQQTLAEAEARLARAQAQLDALRARREALQRNEALVERRIADAEAQRAQAAALAAQLRQAVEQDAAQLNLFEAKHAEIAAQFEEMRAALAQAQAEVAAAETEARVAEQMAQLAEAAARAAPDALASAAIEARLPHVLGVLGQMLRYAPEDAAAVEAALGEWLNALVIRGEADLLEVAAPLRAWLAQQKSGRLVAMSAPADASSAEAVQRAARDFAQAHRVRWLPDCLAAPPEVSTLIQQVWRDVFLCETWDQACALARHLPKRGVIVTRAGEVVYADQRFALPTGEPPPLPIAALDPAAARARLEAARQSYEESQRRFEHTRRELDALNLAHATSAREAAQRSRQLENAERALQRADEMLAALHADLEQMQQERSALETQLAQAESELQTLIEAREEARAALQHVEAALSAHLAGGWLQALNAAQSAAAAAQAELRKAQTLHQERSAALQHAHERAQRRRAELAELRAQRQAFEASVAERAAAVERAAQHAQATEQHLYPLRAMVAELEQLQRALEDERDQLEAVVREHERQLNKALLRCAHITDEISALKQQAAALISELNGNDENSGEADEARLLAFVEALPAVETLVPDLEARMAQLRAQLRRLGAINFEAQQEFEALNARYQFLATQVADLEQAASSLQRVISELNASMRQAFHQTFEAIAAAFQNTFRLLFGGGQARLSLVNAEDLDACGVEIHAQPPGKRPQSLALLSGGERSLTAVALLFAILQVKPTPFCVLDEVDAALDESNIGRFRAALESLSERTQFIIITHNRYTVEAADTIYGISMGADGASVVLSLRLDEVAKT
ncbi:MAG: chromosome segregation protein SMC [Thermoflexales bacterium]|nr:chromosome segregation protein SMC [Thermoflexales bacterium]